MTIPVAVAQHRVCKVTPPKLVAEFYADGDSASTAESDNFLYAKLIALRGAI